MEMEKKVAFAADHAGYEYKQQLIDFLKNEGYSMIEDFGTNNSDSTDYADYVHPLAEAVANHKVDFGIVICGSGNGVNITANKHHGIRSALCWNREVAELARGHNNANVCAVPARFTSIEEAKEIVYAFLHTEFEGGRHERRINKIENF